MRNQRSTRSKAKSQTIHAKQRALQRYGIQFSDTDLDKMVKIIQENKTISSEKQTNRLRDVRLIYEEENYRLIYDRQRKTIVTFLLEDEVYNEQL